MKTSQPQSLSHIAAETLAEAYAAFTQRYPGETGRRQPVHTVYGGAHLFQAGIAQRLGQLAQSYVALGDEDSAGHPGACGVGRGRSTEYGDRRPDGY